MTNHWDEFSKLLAEEPLPRRQSLRLLGAMVAGAALSPLGLRSAWGGRPDPCKAFCNQCPKSRRSQCEAACRGCGSDPRFLCGSCAGGYVCTDLFNDPYNCGACGEVCGSDEYCGGGVCQSQETCIPDCGPGSTYGAGWCGDDGCGGRCACTGEGEYCPAFSNWCAVSQPSDF